jgi:peptidoglycan/xylan/chitin deacetylase (PgdA/CDA1 family)/outer membrane lipoprotein-sorting protein
MGRVVHRLIAALAICVLGGGIVGPPPPAWAQPAAGDALAWLRSAVTAPRRVSYAGMKAVTVWAGTVRSSQVRVFHQAPDRTRFEYLAAGDQPERIVVITGGTQTDYIPAQNRFIRRPAPETSEEGLARQILQIAANYDVRFESTDMVAGREARIIAVDSKFPGRPRLRIWVDTRTRLILRFEGYGPAGALRQASSFLTLQIDPLMSADLFVLTPPPGVRVQTPRGGGALTIEEIARRVGFPPQLPAYLPAGYQFVRSRVVTIHATPTATFAFSDGVSTLTLFESRGPQGPAPNGRKVRVGGADGTVARRGAATLLHWNHGAISFTLVGDLPPDELVRVGASVPPSGAVIRFSAAEAGQIIAGAAAQSEIPPVPPSPYITNDTHPIGPGIRAEEEQVWKALVAKGLAPFVVKVTIGSDGITRLPGGRLSRFAWVWFVYGMTWTGGAGAIVEEVAGSARALAAATFEADPRVAQVGLTAHYHVSGPFDGRRTDVTFTARFARSRFLSVPPGVASAEALARAGDVWYSPALLAGALAENPSLSHDPHFPPGSRARLPALPGDRTAESVERFQGSLLQGVQEIKDRWEGLLFGVESRGRLWRGNPHRREIALTFDDGPHPLATPLLLAVLRKYGVHATFFVIGEHALTYPYYMAEMVADGHEVGDHTYHHPNMTTVDPQTVSAEIDAAASAIRRTARRTPRWFRPPGGDYTQGVVAAARRAGMGLAMWTNNSGDWALPSANVIEERVLGRAEPGAIILLHSGTLPTVEALPRIILELRRRGYVFVTVSQLARDTMR